jgi:hypothetical protein
MNHAFLDEEGLLSPEKIDWVIMNTRETLYHQEKVQSGNFLILLRIFLLKKRALEKQFAWSCLKFDWRTKTLASVGCSLKSRDLIVESQVQEGFVLFEEVMREPILKFTNRKDFQILFVFQNGWMRRIIFENAQIVSSRLTFFNVGQPLKADFIICDEEMMQYATEAISSRAFGEKMEIKSDNLKEIALQIHFLARKNLFLPEPSAGFKFSLFSFHGRKRLWKSFQILGMLIFLGMAYALTWYEFWVLNDQKDLEIKHLEREISIDEGLKSKKEFVSIFTKKKWNKAAPLLDRFKSLDLLGQNGFYASEVSLSSQNIKLTLKPSYTESPSQTLQKFFHLQKTLKNVFPGATIIIHKPPYGIEKSRGERRKKPSVNAKIEINWRES